MEEVNRLLSIHRLKTTPYHPMCNGLVEKFNGTLKSKLKKLCVEQPREESEKAQNRGKHHYDRKAKPRQFKQGDQVLVLLPTDNKKLLMQWKGSYKVEAVVGLNDYRVQVNNKVKVYHANLLKKYVEREHPDELPTATVACLSAEEELDDEKLFDLNEVRRKECIADVKLGPKLSQAQQD
nr:hypothetical protein BaRGS_030952 [Batillaria attramentaria]